MAEEAKGQRFSFQDGGRLGARIGNQGATQTQGSIQSTGASDTSGVQSSGVFLPGISGVNNKVAPTNDFISGIQSGKIQSNIQLPGITDKTPTYPNATMTAMTPDEIDEMDEIAKKNGTYRESWNDIIHDEMLSNEYKQLLKQGVIQTWNDVRKYSYRKGAEIVDYVTKHPYEAISKYTGTGGPFNVWGKLVDKVVVDNNPVVKSAGNIASNKMWQGYYKYEDKINKNFEKWVDKNISKTLAKEYQNSGGIWESIKNWDTDNIKYGLVQGFSTSILPMTPGIIAGIVTKNPYITAGVAFGSTAPIEDQEAYEEAIKEGATREQATEIGKYAGVINGALETVGEFLQIKGLLKPLKKNITKEITRKTGRQIIARGLKEYAQGVGSEALTEGTQEFVTNALIKTINENKDLFEGVLDSIIVGGALSAGPSTLGAGGQVAKDMENNKRIDMKTDLEALDYVLEGEKRKAQRIEQQKEKMRQRANAIKNPTMDNGYTPSEEQAEQRAKENEEREQFEQERDDEYNREMQIENDMMNEVLSEGDLNEDLGDPRYQKSDSPQSVSEDTVREKSRNNKEDSSYGGSESSTLGDKSSTGKISISPENSSEITKSLDEIKKNLEDLKADTFLQRIKNSISGKQGSNYISNKIDNKKYVLRISDHSANGYQFTRGRNKKWNNTSIVIKLAQKSKFKKSNKVDIAEFVYNPENMTTEKMQGIIDGIQNWIKTGEYTDTNYDSKNQSTRKIGENKKSETGEKYQLKYEEEGYTPGVAEKNEKNISGKEGVNLRNKLNKKTVKELAEKYGIKVEVIEGMIKILENGKKKGYAYGKYIDQLLTLSEQIKESTAPHELLHAIFDMIDPETKTYLISQVMKSEGWSASKAEERLADSFSNFFRTGKIEGAPKSTWGKIKIFFKRVRSFINGMGKWRNQLEEIFTDIIESEGIEDLQGKIDRNERINKAKERMRERFKQYQKNAEKMQKKADKSKEKYQTVYHGSPYDFDKFDSANMGKGEGAQAHGWGHYVAVEERTGRHYAELKGRMGNAEYKGKSLNDLYRDMRSPEGEEYTLAMDVLTAHKDYNLPISEAIKKSKKYYENEIKKYEDFLKDEGLSEMHKTYRSIIEKYKKKIDIIDNMKESDFTGTDRNLYEVEIPDPVKADTPTGSNYLEEDKIFTKSQINKLRDKIEKSGMKGGEQLSTELSYDIPYSMKLTGRQVYDKLAFHLGGKKEASKFLESLGYDGIHYFGGKDGEAYVIFNDDALEITNHEKYQKTEDNDGRKLSEGQIEYFKDSKVRDENGNLLRVYHGTRNEFTVFAGGDKNRSNSDARIGNWFTPSEKGAKEWAEQSWGSKGEAKAMGGYLNITNPKIYENWDASEHLKRTEEKRTQYIKDVNKFLDNAGYNPLKETFLKSYFEKGKDEWQENQNRYSQRKAIEDTLRELSYIQGTYNLDDLMYMYGSERRKFVEKMRENGLSDDKIKEISKEASERLKKWKDIEIEFRKANFTDAYELFENDLHSFGGQTVDDRVGGGWMAMNNADEAIKAYRQSLIDQGYDGIIIKDTEYDGEVFGKTNTQYVSFYSNQFKNIDNLNPTDNEDIRFQKAGDIEGEAFKKRFDGSKIVDKKGNPKIVYHGTHNDFTIFDRDKIGSTTNNKGIFGEGFYFTSDKKYGEYYTQPGWSKDYQALEGKSKEDIEKMKGKIMEVYLSIKNPFMRNNYKGPQEIEKIRKELKLPKSVISWNKYGDNGIHPLTKPEQSIKFREALEKAGYDGVIYKYDGLKQDEIVVFNPNQVKSATDNVGTYDINNDDIRYQRVYHGSPAEFDRFDSSHMGEGEGDQVHGRGHYVAVDPKTGKEYAETLAGPRYKGKEMYELASDLPGYQWNVINHVAEQMRDGVDIENAIANDKKWHEYLLNKAEENLKTEKDEDNIDYLEREIKQQKEMIKIADGLKVSDFETSRGRRNFYEVEIPDIVDADTPTGTNYFEENKVLTRSEIEKILNKLLKRKTQGAERVKNAIDYDLKDGEKIDGRAMVFNLRAGLGNKKASKFLESLGYDGIHYFGGRDGEAYVIFDDNDLEIKNHERYQKVEYEYDENGNRKWIKFEEDNGEFDPSIFGENTREEQIEEDKENEKGNPFYNAWMRYNNQNYKDDQKTFEEFMKGLSDRADKEQEIYDEKMKSLSDAQNDPKLLELQLKAIKLMEKEQNVGKKFGKNVSKEVRDRQQAEVEKERENLVKEIFDYMYPGLKFEDATYEDNQRAFEKEAEWEMLGKEDIENKLKLYKKDKNGNREAKEIKIDNPDIKLEKLLSAGKFDEIFEPTDRVIEWKTPEGQKGRIDKAKDPKKFKSVMEKINSGKTKTKVELKDVTNEVRALERYKENEKAEKERRKKEKQEEFAKKKQEEYKRMVRMKAFQRLVDMQRFEKYPFLTEDEIKKRWGFTDEEWKKITEQLDLGYPPKKRNEKAVSDFNKAVDSEVKFIIEGLSRQNNMKQKEAEKNLGEIGEIDLDVLLGKDEEKGAREVEEFERIAKEGKEETGGKMEEGKTAWEKDMEKKNEKAKKQAEKLTKKWKEDVSDMFRKAEEKRNERYANKEEKVIDEVKTVEEAKEITKESRWKRTKKFWKDTTIQDLIQPISSRIEKISPRIYLELMRFEQRVAVKTNTRMKQVEDFVKKMSEIRSKNKKDYLNITLHLLNGNVGTANKMLEKYGTSIPRQVLDEIWADAEDVGYTMNYEGFYYPRKVKDVQDFLDRFARTENKDIQGEIDKIIKKKEEQARKRGEEFTPQMKADLINQLLMEGEVEGISLGSGHMKQRKVESITKNMLEFYEDPVDALLQYITSMTEAVEKARFLGQGTRGEIKTLGEFITDEGITGSDVDELKDLLLSRFNYAPMGNFMRGLKVSANIIHLGSPSSALSQLADISFSLIENGLTNLVQGLANRYNLDLDALGITNRGEELKTQGKNETKREKVQRFTFKMTGFNMMDQFGKKSFVVSTLNKLIKYAKRNDPQLRKDLERWFDDPKMINEIIEDLKEGRMSENVNLFLFTKLADVQPLTRTQMPKTYLQAGNWRVLYAFKTFGIKQLDYLIQTSKRELATKPTAKALWTITAMLGIIMLCGAGTDEIKDFTLGRKSSSWIWRMIEGNDWSVSQMSDRFWDNLLKLVGMTKYSIYQARTQGIKSAIEDIFFSLPGLDIVTYPLQDIQEAMSEDGLDFSQASSWQLLPIVGKYGYWWTGAGQTKQQKALEKEKKKSKKKGSKNKGKIKL